MGSNTLHILYPPTSTFYLDPSIRVYNFQNLTPRICNLPEEIDLCCMALSSAAFLAEEPLVDVEDEKWGHNENSASGYHSSTGLFYPINALCFHESLKTQYSAGCEENRCFLTSSLWTERIQPLVHLSDAGNLCHYFDEKESSYHLVSLIQSPMETRKTGGCPMSVLTITKNDWKLPQLPVPSSFHNTILDQVTN